MDLYDYYYCLVFDLLDYYFLFFDASVPMHFSSLVLWMTTF